MEAENGTFFIVFRMTVASACGESFPRADRDSCSACGDRCSVCGGKSPHRVPRAEDRLRVRRIVSACGDSLDTVSACGDSC